MLGNQPGDARIVERNAPEEFFNHPKSERMKLFLSQILHN
jgi:general L-amino acid transport system ATP-binding protein